MRGTCCSSKTRRWRAQFNKRREQLPLILNPMASAVTIVVPGNKGILLRSGRGVIFADVNIQWWRRGSKT